MVVEGRDTPHAKALDHDKGDGVAEWIGLISVLPQERDGFTVVGVSDLSKVHQRILPKVRDDPLSNGLRPGKCGVRFGEDERRAHELCAFPKQHRHRLAGLGMMRLPGITVGDPERRVQEDTVGVH